MRYKRGVFETQKGGVRDTRTPGNPIFTRVPEFGKNPRLSKTVQDCLRTGLVPVLLTTTGPCPIAYTRENRRESFLFIGTREAHKTAPSK